MLGRVITGLFSFHRVPRWHAPKSFTSTTRSLTTMGARATQTVDTAGRLQALRELMRKAENNVNAYVVPSEDQRKSSRC